MVTVFFHEELWLPVQSLGPLLAPITERFTSQEVRNQI